MTDTGVTEAGHCLSAKASATHLNPGSSWQSGGVSGSWPAIVKLQEHVYDLSKHHLLSSSYVLDTLGVTLQLW